MELVSVIIPVYNVEKYLPECLDSILASTYTNLEVIVVDDGSPDNCPTICDEYASKDSRIKVIHQNNQGIVGARNAGLSAATGTYIGFVDSDDLISPLMYEMLVNAIETEQADMAACEYSNSKEFLSSDPASVQKSTFCMTSFAQQLAVLTNAPSIRNMTWTGCYIWNKLYRRARIPANFRNECLFGEDLRFNWDYIHNCDKMAIVPVALYMYRINKQSVMGTYRHQRKSPAQVANGISNATLWALIAAQSSLQDEPQLSNYLCARAAYTSHGALWRLYCTGMEKEYADFASKAHRLIRSNCKLLLRDRESYSAFLRFMCWLCSSCFPLWKATARISRFLQ